MERGGACAGWRGTAEMRSRGAGMLHSPAQPAAHRACASPHYPPLPSGPPALNCVSTSAGTPGPKASCEPTATVRNSTVQTATADACNGMRDGARGTEQGGAGTADRSGKVWQAYETARQTPTPARLPTHGPCGAQRRAPGPCGAQAEGRRFARGTPASALGTLAALACPQQWAQLVQPVRLTDLMMWCTVIWHV